MSLAFLNVWVRLGSNKNLYTYLYTDRYQYLPTQIKRILPLPTQEITLFSIIYLLESHIGTFLLMNFPCVSTGELKLFLHS